MKVLTLTYFHPINGPRIYLTAPESFEDQISFIPTLMDLEQKGFFELEQGPYHSGNIMFEVKNPKARGGIEFFMISAVFYKEDLEPYVYKPVLEEFVSQLNEIKDLPKGLENRGEDYDPVKGKEFKDFFYSFCKDLPEETVLIDKNIKIIVFGLEGSGKTTLIQDLKKNLYSYKKFKTNTTAKRLFFNNLTITTYDLPIKTMYGKLWEHYMSRQDGFIFVIDANDKEKFKIVKEELKKVRNYAYEKNFPVLILFNKSDLEIPPLEQLIEDLEIKSLEQKRLKWQLVSVKNNENIFDGFDWLASRILKNILLNINW